MPTDGGVGIGSIAMASAALAGPGLVGCPRIRPPPLEDGSGDEARVGSHGWREAAVRAGGGEGGEVRHDGRIVRGGDGQAGCIL